MENKNIRVAITHGDTNGIGYELIFKTFAEPDMLELCTPIIYGSPKIAAYHAKAMDMNANFTIINNAKDAQDGKVNIIPCFDEDVRVDLGMPTEASGQAAIKALDKAMSDYRAGAFDVLVSAPLDKQNLKVEGIPFKGVYKYVDTCLGEGEGVMNLYVNERMRVALFTDELALKNVADEVKTENIVKRTVLLYKTLRRDFRITNPRIAILALNPNADGQEEKEAIIPAVNMMAESGLQAFGPYAAEDFFATDKYEAFDAVLAMYHDQGVLPFKSLQIESGVTLVAGLPVVCTAPENEPSFDIAGKGVANEISMRHAIYTAIDVYRNRIEYDKPYANPLPKLYKDKKDDGEKARYARPTSSDKKENKEHKEHREEHHEHNSHGEEQQA